MTAPPSTALATDRLLEALAVATHTPEQLEQIGAIVKTGLWSTTVTRRPDLHNMWFALGELAIAVALDHSPTTEGNKP